jgi:hypothetical protein
VEVSRKNYQNTNTEAIKYGYTNFGLASFVVLKDDWTLNLGASMFYSMDNQNSSNKVLCIQILMLRIKL